ncbi:MAG: tetratricopeptide repeat protein [Acidobacteria bacterium]|nr:tetratricopeptide repeat protein [Acidobacteriota bacterium]
MPVGLPGAGVSQLERGDVEKIFIDTKPLLVAALKEGNQLHRTMKDSRLVGMAALFLMVVLAPSAEGKNTLRCTIVDEAGNFLQKGEMVLQSAGNAKEWKQKTNDKGIVEFKGLDDGSYQLRGNLPGFLFATSAPIELAGNEVESCQHTLPSVEFYNALLQGALQAADQKKFAEAEQKGNQAVALSPQEGVAHYALALTFAAQGKTEQAVAAAEKASKLNPEKFADSVAQVRAESMRSEAYAATEKQDFPAALGIYEKILSFSPNDATVYFDIALAYGNQRKYDEALKAIDKAIELAPEKPQFQQMKIRLQDMYLKSMDEALELPK